MPGFAALNPAYPDWGLRMENHNPEGGTPQSNTPGTTGAGKKNIPEDSIETPSTSPTHQKTETPRFQGPLKSRHSLSHIKQGKGLKKAKNSVVEPSAWGEVKADIAAINEGKGVRKGNIFEINGRKYELFNNDHLVPIEGPGIHNLNRAEFDGLGILNKLGNTPKTREIIGKNIGLNEEQLNRLLEIWRKNQ